MLSLLRENQKLHLLKRDDIKTKQKLKEHEIINVWQKKDFRRVFARQIVRMLEPNKSLRAIADELNVSAEEEKKQ